MGFLHFVLMHVSLKERVKLNSSIYYIVKVRRPKVCISGHLKGILG